MDSKNYAEVLIDGNVYTLTGTEEKSYFQKVAGYINDKIDKMRQRPGFAKQSADYQNVMIELNIADDYFKTLEQVSVMEKQKSDMEREIYSLKHELVSTQMKLESALRTLEDIQKRQALGAKEDSRPQTQDSEAGDDQQPDPADSADGELKEPPAEETEQKPAEEAAPAPQRPSQKGGHGVRRGGKR